MIRIYFISVFIFISSIVFSQDNYEILFIKADYEKILQNSKNLVSSDDYYWNSLITDKSGESLKAIEILNDGVKKYPDNQILEKLLIELLYKTGRYSQIKPIIPKYLDNPEMFLKFINILGFEGEYRTAISYLTEISKTDSLNIEYLSLLGDFYHQIDSLTAAITALEKLIALNPADQKNLYKLANLYIRTKDFEKAIQVCDMVLVNDTLNKKFTLVKGIAGFNGADFDLAADCFKILLDQGDSGILVLKHLGISEFKKDMLEESREHLLMACHADSNDFEINYFLGKTFLNSPTPEAGLFYLDRVDSLLQPDPKIISTLYCDKVTIYRALGNYNEALKCYEMAYKYNSRPEYIFFMASLYQHELDDKKKALEYYERFLAQLPPKPESGNLKDEKQITVSLKRTAQTNILRLKEELFFGGELDNK